MKIEEYKIIATGQAVENVASAVSAAKEIADLYADFLPNLPDGNASPEEVIATIILKHFADI